MKNIIVVLFLIAACHISVAQTTTASGTVKGEGGQELRYAFVQDKLTKNATYTDSLGRFNLTIAPASQLMVSAKGFKDVLIDVGAQKKFDIVLKADPSASAAPKNEDLAKLEEAFKTDHQQLPGQAIGPAGTAVFMSSRETVGSRFLFNRWVRGYIIKTDGNILQNSSLLLNYDKMGGDLFLTENMSSVMVGDNNAIRSFVLFGPGDQIFTFEKMTGISNSLYCQVISSGSKYKIYKLIKTKFVPYNSKSDGIASTGNTYDEYADDITYYVLNLTTTVFQPLNLKTKSIMQVFSAEGDKVSAYMATHKSKMDDHYLKNLGDAMNQ
jgi:hypothetical protein